MPSSRAWRSARRPARSRWPRARSPRPRSTDDQALYERRSLSMTWTRGRRELALQRAPAARAGRRLRASHLEHRQAPTRARQASRQHPRVAAVGRRRTRHPRPPAAAQTSGVRRSPTTLIVHLSDDAPPLLEGAGPISPETAERLACDARRLTIKPQRPRPPALPRRTLRLLRPTTRTPQTLRRPLPIPRLQRRPRTRSPPPHPRRTRRQDRTRQPHPALPPPPQTPPRPPHPHQRHTATTPPSPTQAGRAITTNQPHAPPR